MKLEIKVMWCKGLTAFNFFRNLTVYAAVSITTHKRIQLTQYEKQEQRTPVGKKNEGDLEWNYPMIFNLRPLHKINPDMNDLSLLFKLRSSGQIFGDKTIGEVHVPLKELIQSVGSEVISFVKYEVRNPEGKHNGVLDFSYKLVGNFLNTTTSVFNPHYNVQTMGYKHHHQFNDQQLYDASLEQHYTNSDDHVIGYTHNHHQQLSNSCANTENYIISNNLDESFSTSNSEIIQYPKIDLDELSSPLLVYPPTSSLLTSTNCTHYNHLASSYLPPSSQMWSPTPPPPSHYSPPLLQQLNVYPPPTMQQQLQPYEDPYWGYQRADYNTLL